MTLQILLRLTQSQSIIAYYCIKTSQSLLHNVVLPVKSSSIDDDKCNHSTFSCLFILHLRCHHHYRRHLYRHHLQDTHDKQYFQHAFPESENGRFSYFAHIHTVAPGLSPLYQTLMEHRNGGYNQNDFHIFHAPLTPPHFANINVANLNSCFRPFCEPLFTKV